MIRFNGVFINCVLHHIKLIHFCKIQTMFAENYKFINQLQKIN